MSRVSLGREGVPACLSFRSVPLRHFACGPAAFPLRPPTPAAPRPAAAPPAGESVGDEGLAHLARLRGSLTALDLGYSCWSHSAAGLGALLQQMTALRMLNIGGWWGEGAGTRARAGASTMCSCCLTPPRQAVGARLRVLAAP